MGRAINNVGENPAKKYLCTTDVYEAVDGETVTAATLLAAASGVTFPDGSVGGAEGISEIQIGLQAKGTVAGNGYQATTAQVDNFTWNGTINGFQALEGFDFQQPIGEDLPPFSVTVSDGSILQISYTVYKCIN